MKGSELEKKIDEKIQHHNIDVNPKQEHDAAFHFAKTIVDLYFSRIVFLLYKRKKNLPESETKVINIHKLTQEIEFEKSWVSTFLNAPLPTLKVLMVKHYCVYLSTTVMRYTFFLTFFLFSYDVIKRCNVTVEMETILYRLIFPGVCFLF